MVCLLLRLVHWQVSLIFQPQYQHPDWVVREVPEIKFQITIWFHETKIFATWNGFIYYKCLINGFAIFVDIYIIICLHTSKFMLHHIWWGIFIFFFIFHLNYNYRIGALRAPVALAQRLEPIHYEFERLRLDSKCKYFKKTLHGIRLYRISWLHYIVQIFQLAFGPKMKIIIRFVNGIRKDTVKGASRLLYCTVL